MGQFKDINLILQEIIKDINVHPSIREAMRNTTQPAVQHTAYPTSKPETYVYVLSCDGTVTDVFTDRDMAMHDLYICQRADNEEGLSHEWTVVKRQLNTEILK